MFLRKILLLELDLSCCVFRCAKGKASYQIWQKKKRLDPCLRGVSCLKATWVRQERLGDVNIDEKLELNWQIIKACNSFRELRSEKVKVIHRWFERFYSNDLEFHVTASSSHSVRVFCIVIVFSSWRPTFIFGKQSARENYVVDAPLTLWSPVIHSFRKTCIDTVSPSCICFRRQIHCLIWLTWSTSQSGWMLGNLRRSVKKMVFWKEIHLK